MSVHGHSHLTMEERCDCGHLRSEHLHLHLKVGRKTYCREGYGACSQPNCPCKRFRWIQSVVVPEQSRDSKSAQP
jgi:hypothetical protein